MLAVCSVCLWLYVGVDISHVDFSKVLTGGSDDGVDVDVILVGGGGLRSGGWVLSVGSTYSSAMGLGGPPLLL